MDTNDIMPKDKTLTRRKKFWCALLAKPFTRRFRFTYDVPEDLPENFLLISNHQSDFDPFLFYVAFPKQNIYFLMSEHLFRVPFVGGLARYINDPIPAQRHVAEPTSVRKALAIMKAGGCVGFFPAGEREWDGYTPTLPSSLGKFARMAKVPVITWRFEGLYQTHPRWGAKMRKLPTHGQVVNIYSAEETAAMTPAELTERINKDIQADSDAWRASIDEDTICKNPAECLEKVFFLCPQCGAWDSFDSQGDRVWCTACSLEAHYTKRDVFSQGAPFATVHQWNQWQHQRLAELVAQDPTSIRFSTAEAKLYAAEAAVSQELVSSGEFVMDSQGISCGDRSFSYENIHGLGLLGGHKIIFTAGKQLYEVRMDKKVNTLKYGAYYKCLQEEM